MGFPINPPKTRLVDEEGRATPEFYRFLLAIQQLIGTDGNALDDAALIAINNGGGDAPVIQYIPSVTMEPGYLTAGGGLTGSESMSRNITLAVGAGTGITVNANDVALDTSSNRNIDHTAVTFSAGAGLLGGGDISANRSFSLDTSSTRNTDHSAVTITAGTGLSGGGDISANRTINLANTAVTPGTYAPPASITVDAQGRITAIS